MVFVKNRYVNGKYVDGLNESNLITPKQLFQAMFPSDAVKNYKPDEALRNYKNVVDYNQANGLPVEKE
jgi:hypothetical protein